MYAVTELKSHFEYFKRFKKKQQKKPVGYLTNIESDSSEIWTA